jgi:hypothetical protein
MVWMVGVDGGMGGIPGHFVATRNLLRFLRTFFERKNLSVTFLQRSAPIHALRAVEYLRRTYDQSSNQ